jgi:hypothetical protein
VLNKLFNRPKIENPLPEKEAKIPTTGEITAQTPDIITSAKPSQMPSSPSRETLNKLSKPTESNLALSQTTESSIGIPLEQAPPSLRKALKFLPDKVRKDLLIFKVEENQYQISLGPSAVNFFPGGLRGLMYALNPLKSKIPHEAKKLLEQSGRQGLTPLLKEDKVHLQALFDTNDKTAKLINLSITDSPHNLLESIFDDKNPAMKKLLTTILDQILPETNGKKKNNQAPEITLNEENRQDFLTLQAALKEKKPEAALARAESVIGSITRTYELEPLESTDEIKLDPLLETSINTLVGINNSNEGKNTTVFVAGSSSKEFSARKIEINGSIPIKGAFKKGTLTVINDDPQINLPLATLLTTLEMALLANSGKLDQKLQPELIKAVIENTKNAAEIAANSQAKAAVAHLN